MPVRRRRRSPWAQRTGFTLIELLVVIVILGLLAVIVGPEIVGRVGEARSTSARTQMELLGLALDNYKLDTGGYPTTEQGLAALRDRPTRGTSVNWRGPYLKKAVPLDPWKRPYVYRSPGARGADGYELVTLGRDGTSGGEGEDTDLGVP